MTTIDPAFADALDYYRATGSVPHGLIPAHVDAGSTAADFRALGYLDVEGAAPVYTSRSVGFEDWTAPHALSAEAVGWEDWTGGQQS